MRFALNKRALLLPAAVFALLSGPALADTDITTATTTAIATSAAGEVTIEGTGAINVTTATTPALKIDSDNNVINKGTISNKNTANAVGVEIVAGHGSATTTVATYNGALYGGTSSGFSIDLTGTGTGKTGLLIDTPSITTVGTLDATATTADDIANDIAPGINIGPMSVAGDNSYGVRMSSLVTLEGSLNIDGAITVKSSTTGAGSSTNVVGAEIDGTVDGNITIGNSFFGGSIVATGAGSRGLVVLGTVNGSIANSGLIESLGSSTQSTTTTGNPQAATAVTIAGSVTGGIYNGGPISNTDTTTAAQIFSQGTGPALLISSAQNISATPIDIGVYTDATNPGFSFYNRGQISAQPANVNTGSVGMRVTGTAGLPVTFEGDGIFNGGLIGSGASTDTSGPSTGIATTALWIDDFVTVPSLVNSNEAGSGHGNIQASVSGASPGQAIAILINKDTTGHGSLGSITNSGSIVASAQTTDTKIGFLNAIAIDDLAGSLTSITNSGSIRATTTTLDNNAQSHIALNSAANTQDIDFQNSGSVLGDIYFGSGKDVLHVFGTSSGTASVTGNINFNGSTGGNDTLTLDDYAQVAGAVLESGSGYVNVTVGGSGGQGTALYVNNTDYAGIDSVDNGTFEVGTLEVKNGAKLGLTLSQGFNRAVDPTNPAIVATDNAGGAGAITLASNAQLLVSFGSFVSTPGGDPAKFVLFDADTITMANPNSIRDGIISSIPFLFTGNVCGYNFTFNDLDSSACTDTPSHEQLVINLQPKTADDLELTGYAKQIFPYANSALATDNKLGAAVIAAGGGLSSTNATDIGTGDALYQDLYSQFAPDITGGARAIVVSLTDQATSVLGAHQRALRMYAGKTAAATLWGQEFVQRLDNGTNNPNGFRDSGFGFALGADGGSPSSGRYGGAFTFFSGDVLEKTPAQVKTSTEWYMLSGYTNWRGKGLFFDSQITVGYGSLSGKRSVFVKDSNGNLLLGRTAVNKRASLLGAAGFSTGAVMSMGTLVVMPQFSMDAMTMRENGYKETGGGNGVDLSVDPYYAKSLRTYVGSTFREDLNLGGFYLQPEARIGYRYDFLADPVKLKAMFTADPNADQFTLTGPAPAKGSLVLGAGFAATTGSWSLGFNYDFLNGGGLTQHTGTLTLIGRL